MQIRHERPMSDLTYKVRAPLKLTLETGKVVAVDNWSLTGITYPESIDVLPKSAVLAIPFQGVDVQFDVKFTNGPEKGELLFADLTGRQRETLAVFYRSILSGKMASTEDVITSLDTPVDLVPMGETEEEIAIGTVGKPNRLLRILWNVFFYAALAFVIFGLIGSQIFTRVSQVTLDHARIVAPIVELRSTENAFIDDILVELGQEVSRGDVLIRLNQPDLESALEDVREDIEIAERDQAAAEDRLLAHRMVRTQQREPLRRAFLNGVTRAPHTQIAEGRNIAPLVDAKDALDRFDQETRRRRGPEFAIDRELQREFEERSVRLSRFRRDLGNAKDAIDGTDIVAQVDGTITSIDIFEDQFVSRGAQVITIEENAPRVARAWLNEARSEAVYVGMETNIRFNDGFGTRSLPGVITDISAGIDPSASSEFGMIITTTFNDLTVAELRENFRPDAPISLIAIKDWGWFNILRRN